jgi:hypothetical protein
MVTVGVVAWLLFVAFATVTVASAVWCDTGAQDSVEDLQIGVSVFGALVDRTKAAVRTDFASPCSKALAEIRLGRLEQRRLSKRFRTPAARPVRSILS